MESVDTSLAASRRGFLVGTILVFVATFAWIVLAGARGVPEWTEYLALAGILAHVFLIHRREQALYASRRWRFWYALLIAGFACDLIPDISGCRGMTPSWIPYRSASGSW